MKYAEVKETLNIAICLDSIFLEKIKNILIPLTKQISDFDHSIHFISEKNKQEIENELKLLGFLPEKNYHYIFSIKDYLHNENLSISEKQKSKAKGYYCQVMNCNILFDKNKGSILYIPIDTIFLDVSNINVIEEYLHKIIKKSKDDKMTETINITDSEKDCKFQKNFEEMYANIPPQIALYGNEKLKEKSEKVDIENDTFIKDDIVKIISTMYSFKRVGMAGPQIGIQKHIIAFDNKWLETNERYKDLCIMVNPEIIEESEEDIALYESCISIPEVEGSVYRPKEITVRYESLNNDGTFSSKTEVFSKLDARIIQHEIDHLDGILFTNKMTKFERDQITPMLVTLRQAHDNFFQKKEN